MFASGYQADLDVNMDGAVDSKDSGVVSKLRGRSLGAGELSDRGNIVGWCGYLYEEATGMWLARHRWQIPELGRWANRDPIGYAGGGQNLYEYVNGNPVVLQDPSGLIGGFFDMIGEGFQQAKSDIGNWLFDTDIEEVHEQQTDNHYNICDNFRKRLGMGRDEECQTEEEWEEQKANLHAAYANNGCDGPPVLTDFGEIAIDALKESAHGFITGDPEHWDEVQDYLDWVGMAPGVGIIADGMNLAISLVRGNWSRALWSASAMVPGWGNASQGVRFGLRNGAGAGGLAAGIGRHWREGGHHIHQKVAFRGNSRYREGRALSISQDFMRQRGWEHQRMTNVQRRMFDRLASSGLPNSMRNHNRIAVYALVRGGANRQEARHLVALSLLNLRHQGIRRPQRIPWN